MVQVLSRKFDDAFVTVRLHRETRDVLCYAYDNGVRGNQVSDAFYSDSSLATAGDSLSVYIALLMADCLASTPRCVGLMAALLLSIVKHHLK